MPKITGTKAHAARLKYMVSPEAMAGIGRALFAAGEMIQVEAQTSITRGAVSGKGHVPSAPGEPPNADTHRLADNIETVQVEANRVTVSSKAPYAADLEYGNSKIAERPYMRPAVAAKRKEAAALIKRAAEHIKRGGTVR